MGEDLFNTDFPDNIEEGAEPMTDFEKAIWDEYGRAWGTRRLTDKEYPPEEVCAICRGCGNFNREDGEIGECNQDKMEGECYHRIFDAEQFGLEVAAYLEK